jgi:ribonuclease III
MTDLLTQSLGHVFGRPELLELALTHRSVMGKDHNERLEFLGDSVLSCVISDLLYQRYPQATEGDLSRLRASLVNRVALAKLGRRLKLDSYLYLGNGEDRHALSDAVLEDAFEALLGAVFLDGGFHVCGKVIQHLYQSELAELVLQQSSLKDAKTQLQEVLQGRNQPLPVYTIEAIEGKAHQQTFICQCCVESLAISERGEGGSRKKAEQEAAKKMLGRLSR